MHRQRAKLEAHVTLTSGLRIRLPIGDSYAVRCALPGHHVLFLRNVTGGWELRHWDGGDSHETVKSLLQRAQLESMCRKDPPLT